MGPLQLMGGQCGDYLVTYWLYSCHIRVMSCSKIRVLF